jgi:hypothetical protein
VLISVHLPKTAGSSFQHILRREYGDKMLLDYEDKPINTPADERNKRAMADASANACRDFGEIECIHGHFQPVKYLALKKKGRAKFVCWLREPLARMVSHYNFWLRDYDGGIGKGDLHCKVVEDKWSLEHFCFSDEMRNFYAQFLWNFPLDLFDFIGITERFDEDLQVFGRIFLKKENLETARANIAPLVHPIWSPSQEFRSRFEEFHAEDYRMYREAVIIRSSLRKLPAPHQKNYNDQS